MHDSAYRIGELVMRTYSDLPNAKILEVGSFNVNGCLRDAAMPTTHYLGLDLEAGPSVDLVITPGADYPVEDSSFDLVMASSVFEHDSRFWDTFVRMCRAARAGGHIYVNAPSNGTVHRYPMDYWRFYPDAGLALAEHARSEGLEIDLVESFIGNRHSDVWNDFAAVFRKGPSSAPLSTDFVYQRYPSINARTWQSNQVYNASDSTEDMALIDALRQQIEEQRNKDVNQDHRQELEQVVASLNEERGQRSLMADHLTRLSAELIEVEQKGGLLSAANADLIGQVLTLESNLRQRQEENEQSWAYVKNLSEERDTLDDRVNDLLAKHEGVQARLEVSDKWVFDLAGERRTLQKRLAAVESELKVARNAIMRVETASTVKHEQLQHQKAALQTMVETLLAQIDAHKSEMTYAQSQLHKEKRSLHDTIEMLLMQIEIREEGAREAEKRDAALHETIASLRSEALSYYAKAAKALEELDVVKAQNSQQACTLRAAEERVFRKERDLSWLRRLFQLTEKSEVGLKGLLPPQSRRQRRSEILQYHGHFDGAAYLNKYPDVAESGMDPLRHYVLHGMAEGRFIDSERGAEVLST